MNPMISIMKRELREYFTTPVAYVFIVIFLFLTGLFTFKASRLFRGRTGRPPRLFQLAPLALSLPDTGHGHAPLGGGAQERDD